MSSDKTKTVTGQSAPASETELKFTVTAAALRALGKHPAMAAKASAERLNATYFDTPDQVLRRAGVSLRVRAEGDRYVQTAKSAAGSALFRRNEWELEVQSADLDIAALAETPVAELTKGETSSLGPVFVSKVERSKRLWQVDDAIIEISVDKGTLVAGKASLPVLELELELKSGPAAALYALARSLFDVAPIHLSLLTKSDRGFALAKGETAPAAKAATAPLTPDMTLADAFRSIARSCLSQILGASEALRREPGVEAVHQTRVGLRRLRTALKIFRPALQDERMDAIQSEARWAAAELGDARSLDVFYAEGFQPRSAGLSDAKGADRYGAQINAARKVAYDRALAAVASERFARLLLDVAFWMEDGDWRRDGLLAPIGPFAAETLAELRQSVRKDGADLSGLNQDKRHKLRLRAKRLRYATQFFELAFSDGDAKRRRRFIRALKALQERLGKLNDIATVEAVAHRSLEGARSPALAFAAGQIVGEIRSEAPAEVEKAAEAYDEFAEAKRYWPKTPGPEVPA